MPGTAVGAPRSEIARPRAGGASGTLRGKWLVECLGGAPRTYLQMQIPRDATFLFGLATVHTKILKCYQNSSEFGNWVFSTLIFHKVNPTFPSERK